MNTTKSFANEAPLDFSRRENREKVKDAISRVKGSLGCDYPLIINGERLFTQNQIISVNPAEASEEVGRVGRATTKDAERAIQAANKAFDFWKKVAPEERANYLFKTADIMKDRRYELAAWQILEVGKNWHEADGEVCEAVDMLRYYAKEMIRLSEATILQPNILGEVNTYGYRSLGVAAVIPPWNFPLAITCGMASASIVAGNGVVLKPSSYSPVIAYKLVEIFKEAGLPEGVLNFLPGSGGEIGDYLVKHHLVDLIPFTGSKKIGLAINALAAAHPGKRGIKRVIAEMGGKNAIIIDSDADYDRAIKGTLVSAFSFQGQKCSACSRLIIVGKDAYDEFMPRFLKAVDSITIGSPEDPANFMGPVISADALESIEGYIKIGKKECELLYERDVSSLRKSGFYISPTVFEGSPNTTLLFKEEIFGPVLLVVRAKDFDEAIAIANDSEYALTAGMYSRNPEHIENFKKEILANVKYINRKITGAIVGRQPFGGSGMSGPGDSKAGGPDYLPLKFLKEYTCSELVESMVSESICEDTTRCGHAPFDEENLE